MINVMFVCLGNICRSPTAHGVFEQLVEQQGYQHVINCHSSGTSGWHIGEPPDPRSVAAANQRDLDLSHLRSEQITAQSDFQSLDYILAMDNENLAKLQAMAPANFEGVLDLLLSFHPNENLTEVPDPYYGEGDGFAYVLDLIEAASQALLSVIVKQHHLTRKRP